MSHTHGQSMTDDHAADGAAPQRVHDPKKARRALFGAYVGTALEWYDFFLFGTTASIVFAPLFFGGGEDPALANIQSLATFGVGFIGRPVGALIAGHFGDRLGRRNILLVTILAMGIASTLIGVLPTFQTAGVVAPILLVILRFVQGLAAGGEWSGAMLMAVENAPEGKRGFYGSIVQVGSPTGTILSSGIVALVVALSDHHFLDWAWRIPYLLSIVLVGVGIWIRMRVGETEDFLEAQAARSTSTEKHGPPVLDIIKNVPGRLLVGIATYLFGTAGFFMVTTFMITYVTGQLKLPATVILTAITWGAVAQIICMAVAGKIADKTSPGTVVLAGYTIAVLASFPIFWLVDSKNAGFITIAMILGVGFSSIAFGLVGTLLTELFPVKVRYSAMALSANLAGIVSGFMPSLAAWILSVTNGSSTGPAILLFSLAAISLIGTLITRALIRKDAKRGVDLADDDLLSKA